MSGLNMFIPIEKIDPDQRMVYGVATAEAEDLSGEICDYASSKPYFERWSAKFSDVTGGKSLGNLRSMHGKIAAGVVKDLTFDDAGKRIMIAAKVVDDDEWRKVEEGVYTGFSQGGRYVRRWPDEGSNAIRFTAQPNEISLVDMPCLPGATFSVVKGDAIETRAFKTIVEDPAPDAIRARAESLAVVAKQHDWTAFADEALADLRKAAQAAAMASAKTDPPAEESAASNADPEDDEGSGGEDRETPASDAVIGEAGRAETVDTEKPRVGETSRKTYEPKPRGGWDCGCADHHHVKKAHAVACMKSRDDAAKAAKSAAGPLTEALDAMEATLGLNAGMFKATTAPADRAKVHASMANFHTQNSGGAGDTADSHRRAAAAHAEAMIAHNAGDKNADEKSDAAFQASRDCLGKDCGKMFAELGADALAKGGDVAGDGDKPYGDVEYADPGYQSDKQKRYPKVALRADLAKFFGDYPGAASPFKEIDDVSTAVSALSAIAYLLQSEIGEDEDEPGQIENLRNAIESLKAFIASEIKEDNSSDDMKRVLFALDMVKRGARNSAADRNRIQGIHDHSMSLGACCDAGNCGKDATGGDDLAKAVAENGELRKEIAGATERFATIATELSKRIATLEAQPMPAKAIVTAVAKGQGDGSGNDAPADVDEALQKRLAAMTPEQRALYFMKLSLANPMPDLLTTRR